MQTSRRRLLTPRTGLDYQTFSWFDPEPDTRWSLADLVFWLACIDVVIVVFALWRLTGN